MVFVKLRVLGDSGGKGEQNCRMSLAFWPFLKRKRGRRKEEEEHEKGRGRQKYREEKTNMSKMFECPMRFCRFCKNGRPYFLKMCKNHSKKQGKMRGAKVAKTRETSDNFGILTRLLGLLGASWGPLGGLLETARLGCLLKASWVPLGALWGTPQKVLKSIGF